MGERTSRQLLDKTFPFASKAKIRCLWYPTKITSQCSGKQTLEEVKKKIDFFVGTAYTASLHTRCLQVSICPHLPKEFDKLRHDRWSQLNSGRQGYAKQNHLKKKKKVKMCSEICCKECRFRNCNLLIKLLLHVKHCVLGETGQPQAVAQTKGIHKV